MFGRYRRHMAQLRAQQQLLNAKTADASRRSCAKARAPGKNVCMYVCMYACMYVFMYV